MVLERLRAGAFIVLVTGAVTAGVMAPVAQGATRTSDQNPVKKRVDFCVESVPPGVSMARAGVLLDEAINNWHVASGEASPIALDLNHFACGAETTVQIRSNVLGSTTLASTRTDPEDVRRIDFNPDFTWWDGTGTRPANAYSYEGVLTHEIGHSFGTGHAGGNLWSRDGYMPTMADCVEPETTPLMTTIQQDDWGMATFAGADSTRNYYSANPGFESDLAFWGHSGATVGSGYSHTGSRGARLAADGDYVYITTVYDPWERVGGVRGVNAYMDDYPTVQVIGNYLNPSGSTGGVDAQYQYWYLRYYYDDVSNFCKYLANATASETTPSAIITGASCGTATVWASCSASKSVQLDSLLDALVFRVYYRSDSSGPVYVDRVGMLGAMYR